MIPVWQNRRKKADKMKSKKIYLARIVVVMLLAVFGLPGCGNKEEKNTITEENVETISPVESTPEPTPTAKPLSPAMSRYHEAVKENTVLLAQQNYLNNAILYYQSIETMTVAEGFEEKSFEEVALGTKQDEEKIMVDYPEFNPDSVEITVPEIAEEEADAKSEELETVNEELKQLIADLQTEADNLKVIAGM